MNSDQTLELRAWADALERLIEDGRCRLVRRVMVIAQTASTQDVAAQSCAGESGLLVLAGRQTAGRGRLGRSWTQRDGLGIAATLTLRATLPQQATVSLAAGVAAAEAVEESLGTGVPTGLIGIRWPNDVVETRAGRKIAGVLIESHQVHADPLLLIGVGVNVLQQESDWPEDLRARAASLAQLGAHATRLDVILALLRTLDRCLAEALATDDAPDALLSRWRARDVLTGTRAAFVSGGTHVEGLVESVQPSLELVVRTEGGERERLPAASTTLLP